MRSYTVIITIIQEMIMARGGVGDMLPVPKFPRLLPNKRNSNVKVRGAIVTSF